MTNLIAELVGLLENSHLCDSIQIAETAYFSKNQFAFKIRVQILSSHTLQIRIFFNHDYYDHSYQVFAEGPICRWDNKEHFPSLKSYPHHFHSIDNKIVESPLNGNPHSDLPIVLKEIQRLFANP